MDRPRTIIHFDLDAFFCAVEEQYQPSLRGTPFAVGGRPGGRGVVASCSYAARRFGIRSAMPMSAAVRLCPQLVVIPPRREAYERASGKVMERLYRLTPAVERISIDEAFLDATGCPEPGRRLAESLQGTVRQDLALPCSLGVSANKLVAKIANTVGKSASPGNRPPNAVTVVPPGRESAFLSPLPVSELWGVGPRATERLNAAGIRTIGHLAEFPEGELVRLLGGAHARQLAHWARGRDDSPVTASRVAKSISKETTFPRDVSSETHLHAALLHLSEGVGRELRRARAASRTIRLKFRRPDFITLTRQATLPAPTDEDFAIYAEAKRLLRLVWQPGQPVRLLGVAASGLCGPYQLSLWHDRSPRLQEAIDSLRDAYGDTAVRWAKEVQRDGV